MAGEPGFAIDAEIKDWSRALDAVYSYVTAALAVTVAALAVASSTEGAPYIAAAGAAASLLRCRKVWIERRLGQNSVRKS